MSYYKNQTKLQLVSNIDLDFYSIASARFEYLMPGCSTVQVFSASLNVDSSCAYYNVQSSGDFGVEGHWKIWLSITDTSGYTARTDETLIEIKGGV